MPEQSKKTACLSLANIEEACRWLGEEGNDLAVRQALELAWPALSVLQTPGGASLFAHAVGAARIVDELRLGHEAVLATLLYPISVDSPMARALLGRELDEAVTVDSPEGRVELELLEIDYS